MPPKTKSAKFETLPSGSVRVRLRLRGHKEATKVFPLYSNTTEDRRRQRIEADEWAATTKREMLAGSHVSTKQAEQMRLKDALCRYRDECLQASDTKASNAKKDRNRIRQILTDPIADRTVASLRKSDIAAYRDELQARSKLARGKELARTTLTNKIQLITRSLSHVGEKIEGVPDLTGVKMPAASAGRDRRVSAEEMSLLLKLSERANPLLPLIIKFAVQTALRRERILELRLSHICPIGQGKMAIRFPREKPVKRKRAGIVPITRGIQELIDQAIALRPEFENDKGASPDDKPIFQINGNTLDHLWRKAVLEAKIVDLHFHDLRHEATSLLFERGLNTAEVMAITGHSTTEMVDRYSHYSAILVFEKLESNVEPEVLVENFKLMIQNFAERGGDMGRLQAMVSNTFNITSRTR
jgi:integrase